MKRFVKTTMFCLLFGPSLFAQQEEYGIASYYSDLFHGKPTASGELYDKTKLTGAHKTLPFGTLVKVTRLDNKKSVQIRINDRGPFISGRVIELSREAAKRVDLERDGSARVKVEVISNGANDGGVAATDTPKAYEDPVKTIKSSPAAKPEKKSESAKQKPASKPVTKTKPAAKTVTAKEVPAGKATRLQTGDLYQIELRKPAKEGYGVQIAAFSSEDAMLRKVADLQAAWFDNILVSRALGKNNEVQYKIILGAFGDEAAAREYKKNLKKNKKIDGFVVDLSTL
jgi:peptidoglycan lytic transglycosylase